MIQVFYVVPIVMCGWECYE